MISGIIRNDYHLTAPSTPSDNGLQKLKKALSGKLIGALALETPVQDANSSEDCDAFTGGSMQYERISILQRHPYNASGAMLLQMPFKPFGFSKKDLDKQTYF